MQASSRHFDAKDIETINSVINSGLYPKRMQIARASCELLKWKEKDGTPKIKACGKALLKLDKAGLIKLPAPQKENGPRVPGYKRRTKECDAPNSSTVIPAEEFSKLQIEGIVNQDDSATYNEYIDRYHPIGYTMLVGKSLRYFVRYQGNIVAMAGFGAAAWRLQQREEHIGWDDKTRQKNLYKIVNNTRFLILPWVKSENLASHLLSVITKRLVIDWQAKYDYTPSMLETFVDKSNFKGTCYKAANWLWIGETKGRGRYDTSRLVEQSIKDIYILPLHKDYKEQLIKGANAAKLAKNKAIPKEPIRAGEISIHRKKVHDIIHRITKLSMNLINDKPLVHSYPSLQYRACGRESCRCYTDPSQRHGPYRYLTATVSGKTRQILAKNFDEEAWEGAEKYQKALKDIEAIKALIPEITERLTTIVQRRSKRLAV